MIGNRFLKSADCEIIKFVADIFMIVDEIIKVGNSADPCLGYNDWYWFTELSKLIIDAYSKL